MSQFLFYEIQYLIIKLTVIMIKASSGFEAQKKYFRTQTRSWKKQKSNRNLFKFTKSDQKLIRLFKSPHSQKKTCTLAFEATQAYGLHPKKPLCKPGRNFHFTTEQNQFKSSSEITLNPIELKRQNSDHSVAKRVRALFQGKRNSQGNRFDAALENSSQASSGVKEHPMVKELIQKRDRIAALRREKRLAEAGWVDNLRKISQSKEKINLQKKENQKRIEMYKNILKKLAGFPEKKFSQPSTTPSENNPREKESQEEEQQMLLDSVWSKQSRQSDAQWPKESYMRYLSASNEY